MSASLLDLVRLTHRVLDFLIQQPAERLTAFAEGRYRLLLVTNDPSLPDPEIPAAATASRVEVPTPSRPDAIGTAGPYESGLESAAAVEPVGKPAVVVRAHSSEAAAGKVAGLKRTPAKASSVAEAPTDIAAELRRLGSVDEGMTYLESLGLRVSDLRAVAIEMGISIPGSLRKQDIVRKILSHAIGARRKFAGLTSW